MGFCEPFVIHARSALFKTVILSMGKCVSCYTTSPKGVFLDGVSGPMNHAHTSSLDFEMLSKHSSGAIGYESCHDWRTDQLGTRYTVFALFENILQ